MGGSGSFWATVLLLTSLGPLVADDRPVIFLGNRDNPPLSYTQDGLDRGLYTELAWAVGTRMGRSFTVSLGNWPRAQDEVKEANADVLFPITADTNRQKAFDFSQPLTQSVFTLFTRSDRRGLDSLGDLGGLRVGVQAGGLPRDLLGALAGVTVVEFDSYHQGFTALNAGTIAAFAGDRWVGSFIAGQEHWGLISPSGRDFASLPSGFAVKKGRRDLLVQVNRAIDQLRADGTLQAILDRWSPKNVVILTGEQILTGSLVIGLILVLGAVIALLVWVRLLNREVRQRTKAEQEARWWARAFDHARWGMAVNDPGGSVLRLVNAELARMHGYEPGELEGKPVGMLLAPGSPWTAPKVVAQALEKGVFTAETLRLRKDGTTFPALTSVTTLVGDSGSPEGLVVYVLDITERKTMEAALDQEREQLAVTLRSIGEGVITTDLEGKVTLVNRTAEEITGWTSAEALGRTLDQVFTMADGRTGLPVRNPVRGILSGDHPRESWPRASLAVRSGNIRLTAARAEALGTSDGRLLGAVVVFRDITEADRADQHLKDAQRLETVGALAGGIAHDFNNLLAGIFTNVELAELHLAGDRKELAGNSLGKVRDSLDRARQLTLQFLTFSKGGAPVFQPHRVAEVVRSALRFAMAGSAVRVNLDLDENLWAQVDENQLAQVIDNLAINAKQAMAGGGTLGVRLVRAGNRQLLLEVSDTGPGILPPAVGRIFEPFFTTKAQGTGLGLASARSIVVRHGGRIEVSSPPGSGAVFQIWLPLIPPGTDQGPQAVPDKFRGTGTILAVDDDEVILDALGDLLGELGFTTLTAPDLPRAVTLLEACLGRGDIPVAAILDLTIPGGPGGRALVGLFHERLPGLPCIASSGYSEDPVTAAPEAWGFAGFLPKPYRFAELVQVLRTVLIIKDD